MPPTPKKGAAPSLSAEQVEEVREAFSLFDVDSSGAISYKELRACMKALQIKVDKDELKKMILEVDSDQSGEIEFPEFLQMMTGKMASGDTREEVQKVYAMFDTDGAGTISFAALKRVAKELGESMTDDEIQSMLEHANKSGKPGKGVSFDDFYRLMQKKHNAGALDDLLGDDE
eukprot:CAMPEP_0115862106 /NCGR_PEP_ID=MMETSP0287-20121206/18004_1 /TAXON_ID=412157 /ORGANISM="Chrysochromulina rotalis, Strain UIO044" /LENGTH=173 /DNA_ID=CAMNT_0003316515 /DNA_START=58 /DNA_END=579 /DNA_ORIENTATION=+